MMSAEKYFRVSTAVLMLVLMLVDVVGLVHTATASACFETCCCKVCSSSTMDAFPYGLPTVPHGLNVPNPTVIGATCRTPVWSDRAYNNTSGSPVTVPSTLYWLKPEVFADNESHVAPSSCSCCQLSVHTSCAEVAPQATRPRTLTLPGGNVIGGTAGTFVLSNGVELSNTDLIQLRSDTFCGYNNSVRNISAPLLNASADLKSTTVSITMPPAGCYTICYYHSGLTTPTWYNIGSLTVHAVAGGLSFTRPVDHVPLAGNRITLTFQAPQLLSVFSNLAELRTSGTCGTGGAAVQSGVGTAGIIEAPSGAIWCAPAVVPKITAYRPLRYISVKYTDCLAANRVYLPKVEWTFTLPTTTANIVYTVCYRYGATWYSAGTLSTFGRQTQLVALQSLYTALNGPAWIYRSGWLGTNPCVMHGVRCDATSKVTQVHLGRNNLTGTLPAQFFRSDLAGTLTHLALDMNAVSGTIPTDMGAMKALGFVDLGFNQMTGTLPPELLGMTAIDIVYVSNNNFNGEVPTTIDKLSLQWLRNNLVHPNITVTPAACPADTLICSDRGSTDSGVFSCGYSGITEPECLVMGCCFNAQAPLVFGGTTCFTKRSVNYFRFPQCTKTQCEEQPDVIQ